MNNHIRTDYQVYSFPETGGVYTLENLILAFCYAQRAIDISGLKNGANQCQLNCLALSAELHKRGFGHRVQLGSFEAFYIVRFHDELVLAAIEYLQGLDMRVDQAAERVIEAMRGEKGAQAIEGAARQLQAALDALETAINGINPHELTRLADRLERWTDEVSSQSTGDRAELAIVRQAIARIHQVSELWENRLNNLLDQIEF